jgi:alanine racemase
VKQTSIILAKEFGFAPLRFHFANSATLFRQGVCDGDMARIGIGAYGALEMFQPSVKIDQLKPVLALYGNKVSSRTLHKGEMVGYGATYCAQEESTITNYDVGYGDGFMRILSNNYTTPDGRKLLGRISMDNSSFEGDADPLCLFDDPSIVAKKANTLSYEILTSLKPHLNRKII